MSGGRSRAPPVADSARRKPAWCVRCASASLGAPRISVPRLKKGDDAEPFPLAPCEKIPLSFLSINPPPPPIFLHLHHSKPLSPPAPLLRSVLSLLGSASRPLTFPRPTPTTQSSERSPLYFPPGSTALRSLLPLFGNRFPAILDSPPAPPYNQY